jgi:ATP-dependent Clp protease adaptor protein ClpS
MKLHSAAESVQRRILLHAGKSIQDVEWVLDRAVQVAPEIQIIEEQEEETELEPLYRVLIHNDHITPMDFVVQILKTIFYLSNDKALDIMMTAHITGIAYVQTLPKSEAEKRIHKAHFAAALEGYPLHFSMEPE